MKIHKNKTKESSKITTNQPNTALNTFVSDKSFDLDVSYILNYLKQDLKTMFYLFKVNRNLMNKSNIYGETMSNVKSFNHPVTLTGIIDIENSELKDYMDTGILREDMPSMKITVFDQELEAKGVIIDRGDVIAFSFKTGVRYFEVVDSNYVNLSTQQTNSFYKASHKVITAIPIKEDVYTSSKI